MKSYICPGCGGVYNGKKCRVCAYVPFSRDCSPGEPCRTSLPRRKKSHPLAGFLVLLCLIGAAIPMLRSWGRELEARETPTPAETAPPVTEAAAAPAAAPTEAEPFSFDTVPAYYQTDYPFLPYGNGTIATSGCGMTCLAMAASYVTDRVYTPDMIVWEFGGYGQTNVERLDYAIGQMQLPCRRNHDWRVTQAALKEGAIAIILVDERSEFTDSAHFILLAGINDQGRYRVIDPFRPNYHKDYLREGFEKGFTEGQILAGLEGSWVFRKEDMGSFRYRIEMPDFPETRYGDYRPVDPDVELLARFLWVAAREESPETQQALAEMVLNRIAHPAFPYLLKQVLAQEDLSGWYRQTEKAQPDIAQYYAVTNAIYGPHILPAGVLFASPRNHSKDKTWGQLGSFHFLYAR